MTLRRSILAALLLASCALHQVCAQDNDELGLWSEIGVEKAITKKWDAGLDLEYRAQNKARFSAGVSTSYKPWKWLKLGISYNFLYTYKPEKYKNKDEGEVGSEYWETGYNHTPDYWYPRHRFSADATGSIKLWKWLKVSLRERYQITHSKARTIDKFKYRTIHEKKYDFDDDWNEVTWFEEYPDNEVESKYYSAYTDQVLRSRLKLEYDKKRVPFSPFISAEFHNSVSVGDHMLLQKVRAAVGSSYKFRKHNEVTLSYIITFDMYDIEDNEVVRQHDRMHAINLGYKYSF
ncbi:MAG: DUF2490 domain-containing protein [Bacteroidaceae bacterium]|nr:DUF2490 domain-containing protein [Bacteroidaceae bacterium]